MEEEDWEVALGILEPIIDKKPKNYEAKFLAAICHTERYRLEKAISMFSEATPYAEETPYFWVKFAKAYLLNEQVEDAERTVRRATHMLLFIIFEWFQQEKEIEKNDQINYLFLETKKYI